MSIETPPPKQDVLLRLKQDHVSWLTSALDRALEPSARDAAGALRAGPRAAGRYRVSFTDLEALRSVIRREPPSPTTKAIAKRLREAVPVQRPVSEPGDRQGVLTDSPDAGERRRVRHRTGSDGPAH